MLKEPMMEPVNSVFTLVPLVLDPLPTVTVVHLVPTEPYLETNVSVTKDSSMMVLVITQSVNHVVVNVPIVNFLLITVPLVVIVWNPIVIMYVYVLIVTISEKVAPVMNVYLNV
jgi:hypothetical protein